MKTRTMTAIATAAMLAVSGPALAQTAGIGSNDAGQRIVTSNWKGQAVKNTQGHVLGKVTDVYTKAGDNEVTGIVAAVGSNPDEDAKQVLIGNEWFDEGPEGVVVNMTADQIAALPAYTGEQTAEMPTMGHDPMKDDTPTYAPDTMGNTDGADTIPMGDDDTLRNEGGMTDQLDGGGSSATR